MSAKTLSKLHILLDWHKERLAILLTLQQIPTVQSLIEELHKLITLTKESLQEEIIRLALINNPFRRNYTNMRTYMY